VRLVASRDLLAVMAMSGIPNAHLQDVYLMKTL